MDNSLILPYYYRLLLIIISSGVSFVVARSSPANGLNGISLTLALANVPPFDIITVQPDGNYTHSGSNMNNFAWLAKKLNFTIKYVLFNESTISKYKSYSDLLGSVVANKVVFGSSSSLIATPERRKIMDLTYYFFWTEQYAMVVPRPGEEPRYFAFIKPFQPTVWILILITSVTMVTSMAFFSKIFHLKCERDPDPSPHNPRRLLHYSTNSKEKTVIQYWNSYIMYVTGTLMNQGNGYGESPIIASRTSFRILVGMWLLVITVIVNSYSSTVISYLTVTKMKSHVNSFEDLADQNDVEIVVWRDTDIANYVMEAKAGKLKTLGDRVRKHPEQLAGSFVDIVTLLRTRRYALPFMKSFCDTFVVNQYKKDGSCRYLTSDTLAVRSGFWSFPLQKDNQFTWIFSNALMELWETGLPFRWVKTSTPQAPKCFAKRKSQAESTRKQPIALKDLISAFLVLGIGVSLAIAVFTIELCHGYCCYRRRSSV